MMDRLSGVSDEDLKLHIRAAMNIMRELKRVSDMSPSIDFKASLKKIQQIDKNVFHAFLWNNGMYSCFVSYVIVLTKNYSIV